MSTARSRRSTGLSAVIVAAALCGVAGAASAQPLTMTQLSCGAELRSNASPDWRAAYPSALATIREIGARAQQSGLQQLDSASIDRLRVAREECRGGLAAPGSRGPFRADAYTCVGEASQILAQYTQISRDQDYRDAACSFATIAQLASRRGEQARASAANEGLGNALSGRHGVTGNVDYLDQAIRAFQQAVTPQGTQGQYLALARALVARNRNAEADAAYASLLALPVSGGFSAEDRAAAFAARARVPGRSAVEARSLWQQSLNASWTAEAAVELGKLQLAGGDQAGARANFSDAARRPPTPNAVGPINYQLEGFYNLSLLDSPQGGGTRAQWANAFQSASAAGNSQPHYRRQGCLSHIGRGGSDYSVAQGTAAEMAADRLRDDAAGAVCTGGDAGPEGQLLRGMYWLRRAQFVPQINDTWRSYVRQADEAFAAGRALAVGPNNRPLDWPGHAAGPNVGDALAFGQNVVNYVRGRCEGSVSPSDPGYMVFDRYDVVRCFPRRD